MKKSLLGVSLCFLLVVLGCSNIKLPGISSDATPTPSTASNTVANASSETNGSTTNTATNSDTTTTNSNASADDEYAEVPEKECRLYLATLKTLSECKSFTEKQRQDFAKIHADTLKSSKTPAATKEIGDLKASVCEMTNAAMEKTAARCR